MEENKTTQKVNEKKAVPKGSAEAGKKKNTILDRLPDVEIGQTVYLKSSQNKTVQAEKIISITIRETNIGIGLQSGREINASELGRYIFLTESAANKNTK